MPHLKTMDFTVKDASSRKIKAIFKTKIAVNSEGVFYANLEEEFLKSIKGVIPNRCYKRNNRNDTIQVLDRDLDTLTSQLQKVFDTHLKPEVTVEHVIIYNIESHVSFTEDEEGNIFPNGTFKGSKWADSGGGKGMYGGHHSSQPSDGGYSLVVGARAMTKTIHKYGDSEEVEYNMYYKGESHHGHDNPAQLLNSWCSFSLDIDKAKQMPYTDESAIFFYNLMMGMAKISQMIQHSTFDQENLMKLIASGNNPFLPSSTKQLTREV